MVLKVFAFVRLDCEVSCTTNYKRSLVLKLDCLHQVFRGLVWVVRFYDTLMESLAICIVDLSKCNSVFVFNFIWDGWIHFPETMFESFFFFFYKWCCETEMACFFCLNGNLCWAHLISWVQLCLKLSFNVLPPLIIKLFKILHGGEEGMGASVWCNF